MKKFLPFFILFSLISPVNAKEINSLQAENIDGLIYEIDHKKPFSGKINTYRNNQLIVAADFKEGLFNWIPGEPIELSFTLFISLIILIKHYSNIKSFIKK